MIYKTIFFLPFLLFGNFVKSQVTISINSKKKIDTLTFQINQFEKIILLVDANNRVSRICNIKYNKLDGFQYYLNEYFLDSLVKFSNDLPTKEKYISSKTGELCQIYQPDGSILDSNYINMLFPKPQTGIQFRPEKFQMLYEYDSLGRLNKISEVDANYNKNGESIELDNNLRIFQVRSYLNNISVFFVSYMGLISVGDYNLSGKRYRIYIDNKLNKFRRIRQIRIYLKLHNYELIKTFKVRKNGKVKGVKANSKLVF